MENNIERHSAKNDFIVAGIILILHVLISIGSF